ncbi:MAG: hypothetical protein ACPGTO_02420 [Polaribacter sp.]
MKTFTRKYIKILVVLLLTFGLQNCATKKNRISDKNILYLFDGKEVSANFIKKLNSSHIEKITVLKGNKEVAKYTDKKYDGVIIIEKKK